MYIILVYDVSESRVQKVCDYLRTYLPRVQNSVFEGELSESRLARMKSGLSKIIDPQYDAVLLWVLRDPKWAERQTMGVELHPPTNFI